MLFVLDVTVFCLVEICFVRASGDIGFCLLCLLCFSSLPFTLV